MRKECAVAPTDHVASEPERIAPIVCDQCGGQAPLMRRTPDAFSRGQSEIWTYECRDCRHKMTRKVE
jgi:hypothetical protein